MSDHDLTAGLAAIRRRRVQMWAVFIGYLPAMVIVMLFTRALGFNEESVGIPAALAWMSLFAVTIVRAGWVRCPRCGKYFPTEGSRALRILEQSIQSSLSQLQAPS
jgi:hypothetical protein